ncbi:hypothetical protein AAMO2058_001424200 [Amorphochlora amoebiformis]
MISKDTKKITNETAKQYKALYKGLHMVFTNRFKDAEDHFEAHATEKGDLSPSLRASHLVLKGFVKFFRAISTWGRGAIDKALNVMWEAEALAATDTTDPLGAKLVQAHAYLQGAFLQIIQKKFPRAAWNIRSSWRCFQGALMELKTFDGPDEIKAEHETSAKLGVGAFNLILSLMPPLVIAVTKILGFQADRPYGVKLLREAYNSQRLMSPIAGQIVLTYLTTLSSMLSEQTPEFREEAEKILDEILKRHPNGLFLLWTKTAHLRSCKKHEEAIKVARIAESVCKEAPALGLMSSWQAGWCNMLLARWKESKECFQKILNSEHKATKDGVPGFYCILAGLSAVNDGDFELGEALLKRVDSEAKNPDIPHEQYAKRHSSQILEVLATERKMEEKKGDKTAGTKFYNRFKSRCYLEQIQLIIEWNFIKYMPEPVKEKVKETMDKWYNMRQDLAWTYREMAWYYLMMSHIEFYKDGGDAKKALELGVTAVAYAKRSKVTNSTLMAQCYFLVANIYLKQDPPDLERAQKKCARAKEKCAGDLAKRMSFLLHALKARIAWLKKETGQSNKKTSAKDSKKEESLGNEAVDDTKPEEQGGMLSGAIGMVGGAVGSAVTWGWGAIAGEEESDDAPEEKNLEVTPNPTNEDSRQS